MLSRVSPIPNAQKEWVLEKQLFSQQNIVHLQVKAADYHEFSPVPRISHSL